MLLQLRNLFYHSTAIIIFIFSLAGCKPFPEDRNLPAQAEIVYITWKDKNTEIYKMTSSGNQSLLTTSYNDSYPVWSPDGSHLAFLSVINKKQHLAIVDADGTNMHILAEKITAKDVSPAWAFDSQMVAFACMPDQRTSICLVPVNGNWIQIMPGNWASLGDIQWAPADPIILFHATTDSSRNIFAYTTYSNSIHQLTDNRSQDYAPTWSPDGRKIAFVSNRNGTNGIYTMNIDGTNPILQLPAIIHDQLHWSPDGNQIAFSQSLGENRICILTVMNKTISCTNKDGTHPTWSPDGQYLVYESRRNNRSYLYITNNRCAFSQRLTINSSGSFSPAWRP